MNPVTLSASATVNASVTDVWNALADCRLDTHWRSGVVSMIQEPTGPVRLGSTTTEVLVAMGNRMQTSTRVTEHAPGRSYRWVATEGQDVAGYREVQYETATESRVQLELSIRPKGFLQRLLFPVLVKQLDKTLAGDVQRLKAFVEARAAVGAPVGEAHPGLL